MKLQITIDGRAYEVDVEVLEDEEAGQPGYTQHHAARSTATHAPSYSSAWDSEGKVCHSPVMGLVIKVNVKSGQFIAAGDQVLVLEAMKMETNVTAPHAGTVKTVHVAPGDSVKLNQVLLEVE